MNEQNDIWEILSTFQQAFKLIENRLDAQDQAINLCREGSKEVENILFDDIINPAKTAMENTARDDRFEDFSNAYGDRLSGYNDALRSIEGDDDFDLTQKAFEDFDSREDDPDADVYVDTLISNIDAQLDNIREKVGAKPDSEVVITQDGESDEPEVEVDGEPVDVEEDAANGEPQEEEQEEKPEEEEEDVIVDELNDETSDEDLEELRKEAEEAISKAGKLPGRD